VTTTRQSPNTFGRIVLALAGVTVLGFLALQLIPVQTDNPPVVAEPKWDSPQTRELAKRACFDCHSNETVWPWYSRIAPVSWVVARDVQEGRERLNFSAWGVAQGGESGEGFNGGEASEEFGESIQQGKMPPASYLPTHPQAVLTDAEKQALISGLIKSLSAK